MVLEKELETFERRLPELLEHNKGQFAVLKGGLLLGTFTTFDEAFEAGVDQWGNKEFLIREVTAVPAVAQFPALAIGHLYAHP